MNEEEIKNELIDLFRHLQRQLAEINKFYRINYGKNFDEELIINVNNATFSIKEISKEIE